MQIECQMEELKNKKLLDLNHWSFYASPCHNVYEMCKAGVIKKL